MQETDKPAGEQDSKEDYANKKESDAVGVAFFCLSYCLASHLSCYLCFLRLLYLFIKLCLHIDDCLASILTTFNTCVMG